MGVRAPCNKYALSVSFGSEGFSPALARVFNHVSVLSLSDYISLKMKPRPLINQWGGPFCRSAIFTENAAFKH